MLMTGFVPLFPGTVIYIVVFGFFRHKGIVSDRWSNGKPMVFANTYGSGVRQLPWDKFADGQVVYIEGYPSQLPPFVVAHHARQMIGRPYDLFWFNCEHFVDACHGRNPESPQVMGVVGAAFVIGLLALAAQA